MKWRLVQERINKDGFKWWWVIKEFKTRKAALEYQRLHYRHSAAPTVVTKRT